MAVAMPVRMPKQSARLAATLYSPPETWISTERALRKGITPGSSRWTRAPRERKSRAHESCRMVKEGIRAPGKRFPRRAVRGILAKSEQWLNKLVIALGQGMTYKDSWRLVSESVRVSGRRAVENLDKPGQRTASAPLPPRG